MSLLTKLVGVRLDSTRTAGFPHHTASVGGGSDKRVRLVITPHIESISAAFDKDAVHSLNEQDLLRSGCLLLFHELYLSQSLVNP